MDNEGNVKVSEGGVINAQNVVGQIVNVGAPEDKSKPYKSIVLIVLGVAAIALVAVVLVRILVPAGPDPDVTEILFDRSARMAQTLADGSGKFSAAIASVDQAFKDEMSPEEKVALRTFGGSCDGTNTELSVPFRQNNKSRIQSALQQIKPDGERNTLVPALNQAATELNGLRASRRTLVVITGGADECGNVMTYVPAKIEGKEPGTGIRVDFRFIGLNLTEDEQKKIADISAASGSKYQPIFVNSSADLHNALQQVLVVDKVKDDANSAVDILNRITDHLNKMVQNLDARNYPAAEGNLKDARDYFKSSSFPFQDLERRQTRYDFKKIYDLASANRQLQQDMIASAAKMVAAAKSENIQEANAEISRFNDLVNRANANGQELNSIKLQTATK